MKFGIKDLALEDRPREKMLEKGLFSLTDVELIAILLGSGSAKESALELAKKIMKEYHNYLNELGKASVEQLKNKFHGVGDAKAISIVASMELGRRHATNAPLETPVIRTTDDIFKIMHPLIGDLEYEEFWIILLNRAKKVKKQFNVSKGGLSNTVTDVRIIFKKALDYGASDMILCHNHPSGACYPSSQDIELTKKIYDAGKILDINIIDHVIITNKSYYSFSENNLLI
jgi:DNA repair protein RadC